MIYTILLYLSLVSNLLASNSNNNLHDDIDNIVNQHIFKGYNVGAVVGVLDDNKSKINSYGTNNFNSNERPNQTTLFEIGSISKVFTGILLAYLSIDQQVNLNDSLSKFLPELEHVSTGSITLLELSTHTSGLPRLPTNLLPSNIADPYSNYTEDLLIEFLKTYQLDAHPVPFSWNNYSNVGVGLLGYVLTLATGKSYEQLIYEIITGPLEMRDTVVYLNKNQELRFSTPHSPALKETSPWVLNSLVGAGGIRSTAKDLELFLRANMNPPATLLGEALQLAMEIHAENGDERIGLGWGITLVKDVRLIGHSGGTGGFRSYVGFVPEYQKAVLTLTNTASDIQCVARRSLFNLPCQPDFGLQLPDSLLDTYEGSYFHKATGLMFKIERIHQHLVYELVGQESGLLVATSETEFHISNLAFVTFQSNESGEVESFFIKQGAFEATFKKQTK